MDGVKWNILSYMDDVGVRYPHFRKPPYTWFFINYPFLSNEHVVIQPSHIPNIYLFSLDMALYTPVN